MEKNRSRKWREYLKLAGWVLLVQVLLANISASIYAYKFTHFYNKPAPVTSSQNFFDKTWKLFVGPTFYKNTVEPDPPFPFEVVRFNTSDGIPIDAWYSKTDSAKGCVIFFHGITVNKSYVSSEAALCRSYGYNVLLVDFRAHGRSGGNNSTFGMKETDEVQQAFNWAKGKGNAKIILYGVSLGAGVCLKAISENKVAPVAMVADMPFGTLHHHFQSRARVLGFPAEPFASLVTMWIGIERGYNGFRHNVASYAKNVHCPVLVQWGAKDQYVSQNEITQVYENLATNRKKLVIYPDADHESFLHVDPNTWNREMQAFLASLP